jgi:phenol hydroxylase P4 protein
MLHAAPLAVALSAQTTFATLRDQVLPRLYGEHPDFARIDWTQVQWLRGGAMFSPRMDATLADHGCHHKTVLRWRTPGLQGLQGSHA